MRDSQKKPLIPSTVPVFCKFTGMPNPRGERDDKRVPFFRRRVSRSQDHHSRFGCQQGYLFEALALCDYCLEFRSVLKRFKVRFHQERLIWPPNAILRSPLDTCDHCTGRRSDHDKPGSCQLSSFPNTLEERSITFMLSELLRVNWGSDD